MADHGGQALGIDESEETSPALQRIADRLAAAIGRPVDIDDDRFRLLAHSSHSQPVDSVRLASILNRAAPAPVIEHLRRIGLHSALRPLRVPASPELGMEARLCVPIRAQETALGFLWLLDDGTLDAAQEQAAAHAAHDASRVLERARLTRIGLRSRAQALVLEAVSGLHDQAAEALRLLHEEGFLSETASLRAAVAVAPAAGAGAGEAIGSVRRSAGEGEAACALRDDELIVLLAGACAAAPERAFERLRGEHPSLRVGIGPAVHGADGLRQSAGKASFAARLPTSRRVAGTIGELGGEGRLATLDLLANPVRRWERLGPYRYLTALSERVGPLSEIEPAIAALASDPAGRELLRTLECFLDLGGRARESAARLHLHRSSLYHRLARIEELLKIDLHDGVQRLDAHLAVKAARVTGLLDDDSRE
ncbi:MAG: PucR family transcriptional regulator [Solirubrobacteraceae bacterium]